MSKKKSILLLVNEVALVLHFVVAIPPLLHPAGETSGRPSAQGSHVHAFHFRRMQQIHSHVCSPSKPPTPCAALTSPTSQLSHLAWKSWGKHKLLPSLGNVPGEQGAHAVTFTLLQLEGTAVVRDGAVGRSPGDVVTSGGVAEAPVDAAVGA